MWDHLTSPIDLYCERTGPEFWAEPVNALTNLAFVAAGLWGVAAGRRNQAGGFVELLSWWVVAIGVGSWLFHTHANLLTIWADIVPIGTFTLAYTLFVLRRFGRFSWNGTLIVSVLFYLAAGLVTLALPRSWHAASNGTVGYLPALLAFVLMIGICLARGSPAAKYVAGAFVLFLLAATFRLTDLGVCEAFPLGTHFLWHVFNGAMLGVLLAAAVRHGRADTR